MAKERLTPEDGVCPKWVEACDGHVDPLAGNPGKWPVCLACAFAAIRAALTQAHAEGRAAGLEEALIAYRTAAHDPCQHVEDAIRSLAAGVAGQPSGDAK